MTDIAQPSLNSSRLTISLWHLQENPSKRRRIPLELLPAARCGKKEIEEMDGNPKVK